MHSLIYKAEADSHTALHTSLSATPFVYPQ